MSLKTDLTQMKKRCNEQKTYLRQSYRVTPGKDRDKNVKSVKRLRT